MGEEMREVDLKPVVERPNELITFLFGKKGGLFVPALLYGIWNRRMKNRESKAVYMAIGKMVVLSIVLGVVLEGVRRLIFSWLNVQPFWGALAASLITGSAFLCLLYPALKALKVNDLFNVLNGPLKKLKHLFF